jgi:hypothetical protein
MTQAYVYKWTHIPTLKWYVGSRYKKGCHPDDGYICSSKIVKPLIESSPQEWQRNIIAVGEELEMRQLEYTILNLFDAAIDPRSFNRTNGFKNPTSSYHSLDSSKKMKKAAEKRKLDPTYQANRTAMFESDEWIKNHNNATAKLKENPNWRANQKKAGQKRKDSKEWYNAFIKGNNQSVEEKHKNGTYKVWQEKLAVWRASEEGQLELTVRAERTRELGKRNAIPVITPDGEFFNLLSDLSNEFNLTTETISGKLENLKELNLLTITNG